MGGGGRRSGDLSRQGSVKDEVLGQTVVHPAAPITSHLTFYPPPPPPPPPARATATED